MKAEGGSPPRSPLPPASNAYGETDQQHSQLLSVPRDLYCNPACLLEHEQSRQSVAVNSPYLY
jgi:hypothetical protein